MDHFNFLLLKWLSDIDYHSISKWVYATCILTCLPVHFVSHKAVPIILKSSFFVHYFEENNFLLLFELMVVFVSVIAIRLCFVSIMCSNKVVRESQFLDLETDREALCEY